MKKRLILILTLTVALSVTMVGLKAWATAGSSAVPDQFVCHRTGKAQTGVVVPVPNATALARHLAHGDRPVSNGPPGRECYIF